ncbi:anthrone oxygenase family protein, partial [Acinetobacter baumannii]|uniref:anthrone oxygenase family protein n=1 Tax=Acinetobacter baumannii TaxID=470 RepID=UPI0013CF6A42
IGLAGSLWLDWTMPAARWLWLASLAALAGIAAITFAWHLPTNAAFAARSVPVAEVPATLDLWLRLHAVRIALGLISAVLG